MSDFAVTPCPKCGKLVITVEDAEWCEAQYVCTCGTAFMFKPEE